jgi:hypothetical protein
MLLIWQNMPRAKNKIDIKIVLPNRKSASVGKFFYDKCRIVQ